MKRDAAETQDNMHTATYDECTRMGLNPYIINITGNEQQGVQGFNLAS